MAKRLTIAEAPTIIMALHDEIRRNEDARYDHRLHAVLLVAHGMSCYEVGALLGDSTRTVQNWVNKFEKKGITALMDKTRPGRPPRLSDEQYDTIEAALRSSPESYGLQGYLWDGKALSEFVRREFDVILSVRQCQRMFRHLGFRYRKPRPMIAGTEQIVKDEFKKTEFNSD